MKWHVYVCKSSFWWITTTSLYDSFGMYATYRGRRRLFRLWMFCWQSYGSLWTFGKLDIVTVIKSNRSLKTRTKAYIGPEQRDHITTTICSNLNGTRFTDTNSSKRSNLDSDQTELNSEPLSSFDPWNSKLDRVDQELLLVVCSMNFDSICRDCRIWTFLLSDRM